MPELLEVRDQSRGGFFVTQRKTMTTIYPFAREKTIENSTLVDNYIIDEIMPTLSGSAWKTLLILLWHDPNPRAYDEIIASGGIIRTTPQRTISKLAGFGSASTTIAALRELEEKGLVATEIKSGYVYVISMMDFYKIGCSKDIYKRLAQLDVGPHPCRIEYYIPTEDMYGLERELHERFSEKKFRNEWFRLNDKELRFIADIDDAVDIGTDYL